jgi:hypothetical protein
MARPRDRGWGPEHPTGALQSRIAHQKIVTVSHGCSHALLSPIATRMAPAREGFSPAAAAATRLPEHAVRDR